MIQRIQSIYLLVVTILSITICFFNFGVIGETELNFMSCPIYAGLSVIIPLVSLVSIFLFKKRILQMRFNSFNIILMVFQAIMMGVNIYYAHTQAPTEAVQVLLPICVPPINIILTYLAIRAIGKDEAMVRAMDRIR